MKGWLIGSYEELRIIYESKEEEGMVFGSTGGKRAVLWVNRERKACLLDQSRKKGCSTGS